MPPITTGNIGLLLQHTIQKVWGDHTEKLETQYTNIFTKEKSAHAYEEALGMTSFGLAPELDQADGIKYDSAGQGFRERFTNRSHALGFTVTKDAIDDNTWAQFVKHYTSALAFSMHETVEVLAALVLNRAFTATYTFGDGKSLCATDHPNIGGGTWSNRPSDNSDLNELALENAYIDIAGYKTNRGLTQNVSPVKLVIPVNSVFDAERLFSTTGRVGTSNNDVNAMKRMRVFPQGYYEYRYLTDTDSWFITTNFPKGLTYIERQAISAPVSENDFDTENRKFKSKWRGVFGCWNPRAVYGCPGA
jgi:phage major head subunit gpT-like protein